MRKKTKTIAVTDRVSQKAQNINDQYLQGVENINMDQKEKKTSNNKSSPVVKDLRLFLNKSKQPVKKQQNLQATALTKETNNINNSSQPEINNKQKVMQLSADKVNTNINKTINPTKQSKESTPISKIQQSINNNPRLKEQNTKAKRQSSNKTNTNKKPAQKQQPLKQVRKQTSSTKLSQPYQLQSSIINRQKSESKNASSHSKQVDSKISNKNAKIHSVKQKRIDTKSQKTNPHQKSIHNFIKEKNQPISNSINKKQEVKDILQILSKNQTSPKSNDKNYIKHNYSTKKIQPLIIDNLKKSRTKQNQTQIKKSIQIKIKQSPKKKQIFNSNNTVKELVRKLSQTQSKSSVKINKINKKVQQIIDVNNNTDKINLIKSPQKANGTKLTVQKTNDKQIKSKQKQKNKNQSLKKVSLGLESQIKLNTVQDNTKMKKALENSLVGSPAKTKIFDKRSNSKPQKDCKTVLIITPQPQVQIKQQPQNSNPKYTQEDIKRIKFLKRLQNQKTLIQQRQQQKKQQQQLQRQKSQQKKKQQQQRLKSQQLQKKRRSLSQRIEQIQRRKQQRKNQLIKQNKQYLQKKNEFTLQHKLINQYLEKELQENQIKERQLQAKISKMKPSNLLQEIQQHAQLIQSYKKLHQSRFMESDLKYQQQKSRLLLSKLYKSNWYKRIQQNDPLETFQIEEEKKKQEKQLLLMKLDNRKKYSEYVKVNYKPDCDQQSTFKYQKRIIADLSADKIRRMGLQNLDYSKQHAQSQKKFHSQTERKDVNNEYKNYLQQLKTQRLKKQKPQQYEDFDNMIEKIKFSTTLTKEEKVKKITQIAKKIESQAKQKQKLFNKTHQKGIKVLQKQIQNSQNIKRGASLPTLSAQSTLQPKLKINKTPSKQKQSTDELLKQIQSKFKLLQKIQNV